MKKHYTLCFFFLLTFSLRAQIPFSPQQEMDRKKLEGKATGKELLVNPHGGSTIRISPSTPSVKSIASCNCWIQRDSSFQVAPMDGSGGSGGPGLPPLYRNDDWSTPAITLPFSFCFYGQPVTAVYINNNGNVSIGNPYSTFTANGFPDPSYSMIAPFWSDVDTRGANSGVIYYKLTPTYLIVQWDGVGYFNMQDDRLNTYQLIITDNNDAILGPGNNISFCYQEMQWTTGDASGGTGGFGGFPATVGLNKGNGIDFMQFGTFDSSGSMYDGPYGNNDGVEWLTNRSFTFGVCTDSSNVPPILSSNAICDTVRICEGNSQNFKVDFCSPEPTQITTIQLDTLTTPGVTINRNDSGNVAFLDFDINAPAPGLYSIHIIATDNAVNPGITDKIIFVQVYPAPVANATFSPASPIPTGTPVTFTNLSSPGTLATWDFGDGTPNSSVSNPVHLYTVPGYYTVTLTAMSVNGCTSVFTTELLYDSLGLNISESNMIRSVVYPNPTRDVINISVDAGGTKLYKLMDSQGRVVRSGSELENVFSIDVSELVEGHYILNVTSKQGVSNKQVFIIR